MAGNDTAALVVALSAQLSKFEKDMKSAVDVADRRTKEIETTFSRLNSTITNKLSSVTSGLTANLGFAGSLLTSLGPAGLAAAAGAGAAAGAIYFLAAATAEFAEKSKALKENAETIGLTIGQLKTLSAAGKQAGLDSEETSAFFTKYIANLAALREGGGPLYDALLKIDSGLLRQLASTKDSAQAIDILVKAYARLEDQTQKLNLARAAGGRAGLSGGRLLQSLADSGGMDDINEKAKKVDEDAIERAARLSREIAAIEAKTKNIWGGMFSDSILSSQKATAEVTLSIAQAIERIAKGKDGAVATLEGIGEYDALGNFIGQSPPASAPAQSPRPRVVISGGTTEPPPAQAAPAPTAAVPAAVDLDLLRQRIALLGDAVTQGEQYRLKQLEIAAAVEKNKDVSSVAGRALAAFNVAQQAAAVATRERLGVATEQQIVETRLAQLQQDATKYRLSDNEVQRATVIILREAKQAADQLAVRQAYLPGLKQLELDAASVAKGLDTLIQSGLNTFTDDLAAFVTGTKSAKDAFADMAKSIANDIAKLAIRQALVAPLAKLFGGLGGAGGLTLGGPSGPVPFYANGTDFAPGGLAVVGEQGAELVNLPRGSQVIPNDVLRQGGGTTLSIGGIVVNMPEGSSAGSAVETARALKDILVPAIDERLRYHTRSRGLLA